VRLVAADDLRLSLAKPCRSIHAGCVRDTFIDVAVTSALILDPRQSRACVHECVETRLTLSERALSALPFSDIEGQDEQSFRHRLNDKLKTSDAAVGKFEESLQRRSGTAFHAFTENREHRRRFDAGIR